MNTRVEYRRAVVRDIGFLSEMLAEAAAWQPDAMPSVADVLANPFFARYITGWPRAGDCGVIAADGSDPIGATWYRHFAAADQGFGFVTPAIPELSMAVVRERRGQGVGRGLLRELMRAASEHGCGAISLSVEPDNPARYLYESLGFRVVGGTGGAWTMLAATGSN